MLVISNGGVGPWFPKSASAVLSIVMALFRPPDKSAYWKLFFLFLSQNICCGYSKEPSQWDGSFEHPKHMFKLMGKDINAILGEQTILIWTYVCYGLDRHKLSDTLQPCWDRDKMTLFSRAGPEYWAGLLLTVYATSLFCLRWAFLIQEQLAQDITWNQCPWYIRISFNSLHAVLV